MASVNFLTFGSEQPPAAPLRLQAGPLSLCFEPATVFLRRINLGQAEVMRGIYAAVRDRNWGTVPPRITDLDKEIRRDSFQLRFEVDCRQGDIHFRWRGEISGAADGTVEFIFDGEALTTFLKSRIGFCVLHPVRECAGARARYQRADGHTVELTFPRLIAPQIFGQAAFRDMRRLAHEIQPGLWADLTFQGEVFETEDQRNWTDASFKTYCTPLALPYPVEIQAGTRVRQSVTLRLVQEQESGWGIFGDSKKETSSPQPSPPGAGGEGATGASGEVTGSMSEMPLSKDSLPSPASMGKFTEVEKSPSQAPTTQDYLLPDRATGSLPRLGACLPSHGQLASAREIHCLRALRLSHLRAEVRLGESGWCERLSQGISQAGQLGSGLELAIHLPAREGEDSLAQLSQLLSRAAVPLARLLIFREGEPATTGTTLKLARSQFGGLGIPIGGGTNAHFCELNREQALGRFGITEADFVAWPMTPQVHAFDNLSLLETLEAQPDTVASARAFAGRRPLALTPVTLKPRFNAVATAEEDGRGSDELPPQADPRQMSCFTACWTLGSISGLALAGAESATYYQTTGWLGLMETESGCPLPAKFPSVPGMLFPVFLVFAALAGFRRMAPLTTATPTDAEDRSRLGSLAGLCLFDESGPRRVLLADLTGRGQTVRLRSGSSAARVCVVDGVTLESRLHREQDSWPAERITASSGSLELSLQPHAFAWLDFI